MNSRKFIYFLVVVLLLAFFTGCNTEENDTATDSEEVSIDYMIVEGGEVSLPLTPFNTLNPLMTNNLSYYYFSKLMLEGLFEFDENLEPTFQLAESYEILSDGRTIEAKLREDVYWHDGEKLTSDDVLFTVNTLINSTVETAYESLSTSNSKIIGATVIDDYNIEINFSNGSSNNVDLLTFPIIPSHRFKSNSMRTSYSMALEVENYTPIGTGPFKFESYDNHKNLNLKANENYRSGKPGIENIVGKVLNDEELFITAYEAGQINITPVTGVDWDKYKENSRIRVLEYVSNDYEFLGFNFKNPILSGENGATIRQAINYGINRQDIIQKVYLGHATQVDVPIHPNSYLLSDQGSKYGYTPTLSKELLETANIIDRDGDGIAEDADGNKMSFRLITNSSNLYRYRVAEMISEDLKEIGIDIVFDFNTNYESEISLEQKTEEWNVVESKINRGNYDIALLGWQLSYIPDLYNVFHSSQVGSDNFTRYSNENMDSLLINADKSYNRESKISAYGDLQQLIIEELPYISLFFRNKALLVDNIITGELSPTIANPYNGLENCIIVLQTD